jgi:hypothetical protein
VTTVPRDRSKAIQIGVTEGDDVFILGFPNLGPSTEIVGNQDFVIVRGGTIARIKDCLAGVRNSFLVVASCFRVTAEDQLCFDPK